MNLIGRAWLLNDIAAEQTPMGGRKTRTDFSRGPAWTNERVELLKKLWAQGLSASQIAAQLGGGITRNAVIGKVHRLKLSGRAKPVAASPLQRAASQRAAQQRHRAKNNPSPLRPKARFVGKPQTSPRLLPPPQPIEDIVVPVSLNLLLLNTTGQTCKWATSEFDAPAQDIRFCGHKIFGGLPYCEYHSRLAYQPPDRRRDQRYAA